VGYRKWKRSKLLGIKPIYGIKLNKSKNIGKIFMKKLRKVAAVDIGTNTIRLLVVSGNKQNWEILHQAMNTSRLGQGMRSENGSAMLQREAMDRSLDVVVDYAKQAQAMQVDDIRLVATSAVREAENGREFTSEVFQKTGIQTEVVSGEKEAELSLKGVGMTVDDREGILVLDIGGGSTEFILSKSGKISKAKSIPVGAVVMTEKYLHSDQPQSSELNAMRAFIQKKLEPIFKEFGNAVPLVGTAGTITTIGAVYLEMERYDYQKINGLTLHRKYIKSILKRFTSVPLIERRNIVGLEPKRADIITAGTEILMMVINVFSYTNMLVSDFGLREGIIAEMLDNA